jgi:DNA-binding NarL/FixJ family response regulator
MLLTDNSAVPLIVFSPQREPAEFINSLMRKAGEPVHCTWIPAVRDLGEALEQLNPELLICAYVSETEAKQATTVRDQLAPQVPIVLVRPQISEGDIANGMRIGARDVVSLSATDRVQAVISRELRSFRLERALNTTLQSGERLPPSIAVRCCNVPTTPSCRCRKASLSMPTRPGSSFLAMPKRARSWINRSMDLFDDRSHAALKGALVACGPRQMERSPAQGNRPARRWQQVASSTWC